MSGPLFNKKEISQILKKASEIQTQKDLYGDKDGLTQQELVSLAEEVGIDKDSLLEAIANRDVATIDNTFNWIKGTSKVQNIASVDGEISAENWDEVIREIRRVIGGIGKDSNQRGTFEWEQRLKEIGYRHISLTPANGKTRVQYVYSWRGIKFMSNMFGFMIPAMFVAGSLGDSGFPLIAFLAISGIAGIAGVFTTRIFLKPYFEKQKKLMQSTLQAISRTLKSTGSSSIMFEENAYENADTLPSNQKSRA